MKTLLLTTLLFLSLGKRLLFWLALVQQKEYRLDRIKLYLISREGGTELWSLLPRRSWLQVKLWKRPRWTARVTILAVICCITTFLWLVAGYAVGQWLVPGSWGLIGLLWLGQIILCYVAMPGLVMVGLLPTALVSLWATRRVSQQARALVKRHHPLVIGITGSYGKTSTKQLLAHVLASKYSVFATPASYNTLYSVAKSITDHYQGEEVLILEYGAYKTGEIARLCQVVPPSLAVITGITAQHLGIFGSVQAIITAKSELTQALPPEGVVFYNASDTDTVKVASAFSGIKYGYADPDDRQIPTAGVTADGRLEFVLDSVVVKTQLIGLHYLSCLEAALSIGEHLGVPRSQIIARLMSFTPTANFTRLHDLGDKIRLLDNGRTSNPVGYQAMLELAGSLPAQTKILIFGGILDLGEQTDTIHTQLARASAKIFDYVWYVNPTGHKEFDQAMPDQVISQRQAILAQWQNLQPDTLVVIEGRLPAWLDAVINQRKGGA